MKEHIIRIKCDVCRTVMMDTKEVVLSMGKKAWAADVCGSCMPKLTAYLESIGMGGPQARKLPGTPDTAKGTAAPAKKQAVKSSVKAKPDYKGKACLGCGRKFNTQQGRRTHNTRTGCA